MVLRTLPALLLLAAVCPAQTDLFQITKVWTVHLGFTKDQFGALEPAQPSGRGGFGFGQGEWLQGREGQRNGLASAMGIEFRTVHADFTLDTRQFRDAGVRYKGNGTYLEAQGDGKFSFKIDLSQYVKGQKLDGISKLNLHNNITDGSWMNEVLSYRLYRDAGVPAPRTAYARVYLTVAGLHARKYAGLYSLVENVDGHFIGEHFTNQGGAILKPVSTNLFRYLGEDWAKYNQTYDPKTDLTPAQKKRVIDFTKLVTQADDAQFAAQLEEYVDLDEFSRFMAVMVFLSDMDGMLGPGQNFYLYLDPKTQKLSFVPWDQDHSFGQFPHIGTQRQRENLSIQEPWQGHRRFLERVFHVEHFRKLYLARMEEFSSTLFAPQRFWDQVDEIAAVIRPAVKEESEEKLARFERAVAGTSRSVVPIKPFVKVRAKSVGDQLAGKSRGERVDDGRR